MRFNLVVLAHSPFFPLNSQLGVQIDGFCSTVAHTLVVGASAEKPVTGEKADVIQAAHTALEAACRVIRPGNKVIISLKIIIISPIGYYIIVYLYILLQYH